MSKGKETMGTKEAQRKALQEKAYERQKATVKQVGKLASVKASARKK